MKRPLAEAIQARYPALTPAQRDHLETALLLELAAAITRGESVALIRPLPDGSMEVKRFAVTSTSEAPGHANHRAHRGSSR